LPPAPTLTRLCGARELACGIGILTQPEATPWLQARVVGDALDLACLAGAAPLAASNGRRVAVSMAAVAGVTALDVYCAKELAEQVKPSPVHAHTGIEVDQPPEVLYRFWRDFDNLPRVMPHLKSVRAIGAGRLQCVAKGPGGESLEWESEIIDDRPNVVIAWRSVDGAKIWNAGSVSFAPTAAGGTYVSVELLYYAPSGSLGTWISRLFGADGDDEMRVDLRALKALMEGDAVKLRPAMP